MDDVLRAHGSADHARGVLFIQIKEEFDKCLGGKASITVENGVFSYPQLEGVFPEVDAVLILETVGVGSAAVHEPVDHVLVLDPEDPLTDDQGLETEGIKIQADGIQFSSVGELARVSVLLLGKLDLFGQTRFLSHLTRRAPVLNRALRVVMLVKKCGAEQFKRARNPLGTVIQRVGKILENFRGSFEAGGLQCIILVSGLQVRVGAILEQQFCRLEPVLLDGVVEGGLALDVLGIDLGPIAQQELAELDTLDAVDETGAAVVVWLLDVCVIIDQELDDVKVGHEAGGPHGGGAGVGH